MDQVQMPLFNRCILALRLAWRGAGEVCEFGPQREARAARAARVPPV